MGGTAEDGAPGSGAEAAEARRLAEADQGRQPWRRWGPYVAARAWGTVREDYSADGESWVRSRTTTPGRGPTAGPRTAWPRSATSGSGCASASPFGTVVTRSSRSGCSG